MRINKTGRSIKKEKNKISIPSQKKSNKNILLRRKNRLGDIVMCCALAHYLKHQGYDVSIGTLPVYKSILSHVDPPIAYENYEIYDSSKYNEIIDLTWLHNNNFEGNFSKQQKFFAMVGIDPSKLDDSIFVPKFNVKEEYKNIIKRKLNELGIKNKIVILSPKSYNKKSPRSIDIEQLKIIHDHFKDYNFIYTNKEPLPCSKWGRILNWSSNTPSLDDLIATIDCIDYVVSVDTGIMHLACSLNKPTLSLWGPTDPMYLSRHYRNIINITSNKSCCPCWDRGCDQKCLSDLPNDLILESFNLLVNGFSNNRIIDFDRNIKYEV